MMQNKKRFVPHELDVNLIVDTRRLAGKKKCDSSVREQAEYLIDQYQIAYDLNCGPDLSRAFHWSMIARERRRELQKFYDNLSSVMQGCK